MLNRKVWGGSGVFDLLPIIIIVLFLGYMLMNFGYYIKYLNTLNDLDNISKKYALIMETTSGLTEEDKEKLFLELKELGIKSDDVDMSGTTFYDKTIGYGDEMYLKLKVLVSYNFMLFKEDMSADNFKGKREVNIKKCVISLS